MEEENNSNSLVTSEDILKAVKVVHGEEASVINYHVKPATSSVQGFMSVILRVTVTVQVSPECIQETSFIVKRLPLMKEQLDIVGDCDFFDREIDYFNKAIPILKNNNPDLSVVTCYITCEQMIIMEDLCTSGYQTLSTNMEQVGKGSLTIDHVRVVMQRLAQLHAASLGVDWLNILPSLQSDALFEGHGRKMMESYTNLGCKAIVAIIHELFGDEKEKYSNWLLSSDFYEKLLKYVKPSDKYLNVLCHGDFWENNMMFKFDIETNTPVDVKFIDLQLIRYGSITTDFFYFLFLCTDKSFRDAHEVEILETYVTAFNEAANKSSTPTPLTLEDLRKEYEEGRLFGALLAATMRPILLIEKVVPGEAEEMSNEQLEQIMFGIDPDALVQQFRENEVFRGAMTEMVDELLHEMDVMKVV